MENKLFRATLVTSPEEIKEAQRELHLDNGILETFSDLKNFVYLLKHKSATGSDVYMMSRGYINSPNQSSDKNWYHLMLRVRTAVKENARVLSYDSLPNRFSEESKSFEYPDGAITTIPSDEDGRILTPSFYLSLESLLDDKDFREGIRNRDPLALGRAESGHSILTFNPSKVKAYQIPLI